MGSWSLPALGERGMSAARNTVRRSLSEARTAATITLLGVGLAVLVVVSRPLRLWKLGLAATMGASYAAILELRPARQFFQVDLFDGRPWVTIGVAIGAASLAIVSVPALDRRVRTRGG